ALVRYVSPTGSDTTGDGTAGKPFATLGQAGFDIQQKSSTHTSDGGTIYLAAGNYTYGTVAWYNSFTNPKAWLTITAAPGVKASDVKIVAGSASGLDTN